MSVRRLAKEQPASFAFSKATMVKAEWWIKKYPESRRQSAVIPILWLVQKQEGWVSEPAIRAIAELLDMAFIRVLEVATFYTMFMLEPVGSAALIQVCGTTPCMLRGAGELMKVCKSRIGPKQTLSADGKFYWEEVECLGACVNAPMAMIWSDTYEDLTKDSMNALIDGFKAGTPPQPGSQIGRQFAAPEGGARTLIGGGAMTRPPIDLDQPKEPALADGEAKKPTKSASDRESPAPKAPAADATKNNPPTKAEPKGPTK